MYSDPWSSEYKKKGRVGVLAEAKDDHTTASEALKDAVPWRSLAEHNL